MGEDLSVRLWILGLRLKGIGHLLSNKRCDGTDLDEEDCWIGSGLAVKALGEEALKAAKEVQTGVDEVTKRKATPKKRCKKTRTR